MGLSMPGCVWGGQRAVRESWFSSSTMWLLGTESKSSASLAGTFKICWAHLTGPKPGCFYARFGGNWKVSGNRLGDTTSVLPYGSFQCPLSAGCSVVLSWPQEVILHRKGLGRRFRKGKASAEGQGILVGWFLDSSSFKYSVCPGAMFGGSVFWTPSTMVKLSPKVGCDHMLECVYGDPECLVSSLFLLPWGGVFH